MADSLIKSSHQKSETFPETSDFPKLFPSQGWHIKQICLPLLVKSMIELLGYSNQSQSIPILLHTEDFIDFQQIKALLLNILGLLYKKHPKMPGKLNFFILYANRCEANYSRNKNLNYVLSSQSPCKWWIALKPCYFNIGVTIPAYVVGNLVCNYFCPLQIRVL